MLNVLQYILKQPNDSLLLRIFEVQPSHPTKGDWASNVKELLQAYSIDLSMTQIKNTRQSIFKALVKRQTEKVALKTLLEKQQKGQKGRFLKYERLELADYLLPECEAGVEDKREIFNIRTEMDDFPCNFGNKTYCDMGCKEILNSEHLLTCSALNEENNEYEFMNILQGTMKQKVMVLKKIQQNKETKKKITNSGIQ